MPWLSAKAGSTAETLKATPTWTENTYKFSELDKYDAEGYEYTYTVEEAEIYGYETAIEGFDITNTLILCPHKEIREVGCNMLSIFNFSLCDSSVKLSIN